ncbi:23S rRNA pseudouridine(2604) synthase RluF [Paraflavitalea pollutisoli]|uniref:23S rRNA pseudouridine(2604) synthase RluF n=1 Tax=Paraflavitalea pollutisoli TaxID=3034143 RepID=UPI0023EAF5E1|nr:23S rRNA pseudouridine(2604) synthase RluF [Paraflavitalea sp. H1-2-19X]
MDNSISLNKFISDTGYCSRREADNLITTGRVLLNNRPAQLGNRYKPGDVVEVDGSIVTAAKKDKRVYLALNKPTGITTTTELHIKDNIISFVNYPKRIFPIGRLDKDSEGLILLTNDGDIINKILRADNHHEKEYIVRVNKPIDHGFIQQMSQGVHILDTVTLPCKVFSVGRQTFRIILTQGLNRQIRRMCEQLGYNVVGLQRVRIMNIKLDKLAVGKWRYLSEVELAQLMESIEDSQQEKSKPKSKPASPKGKSVAGEGVSPAGKKSSQSSKKETASQKTTPFWKKEDSDPKGAKSWKKNTTQQKGAKPWKKEDKDSKEAKPWKQEAPAPKSSPSRPGKAGRPDRSAGKEKQSTDSKRASRNGEKGSFKNYRNKGRGKG